VFFVCVFVAIETTNRGQPNFGADHQQLSGFVDFLEYLPEVLLILPIGIQLSSVEMVDPILEACLNDFDLFFKGNDLMRIEVAIPQGGDFQARVPKFAVLHVALFKHWYLCGFIN
jgi:hypothetical protein